MKTFPQLHRVDHFEVFLSRFGHDDLQCDFLQVVAEEVDLPIDARSNPVPIPIDELNAAVLNDMEGPLARYPVSRCRACKRDPSFLRPYILSDRIAQARVQLRP